MHKSLLCARALGDSSLASGRVQPTTSNARSHLEDSVGNWHCCGRLRGGALAPWRHAPALAEQGDGWSPYRHAHRCRRRTAQSAPWHRLYSLPAPGQRLPGSCEEAGSFKHYSHANRSSDRRSGYSFVPGLSLRPAAVRCRLLAGRSLRRFGSAHPGALLGVAGCLSRAALLLRNRFSRLHHPLDLHAKGEVPAAFFSGPSAASCNRRCTWFKPAAVKAVSSDEWHLAA